MKWANTGSTSDIVAHRQKDTVKPRLNLAYFWEQGCQISNYYTPFKVLNARIYGDTGRRRELRKNRRKHMMKTGRMKRI